MAIQDEPPEWLTALQSRGWGRLFSVLLTIIEPVGPLGAQLLWVAQPATRFIGGKVWGNALHELAQALETPAGIETLRSYIDPTPEGETGE